MIAIGDRVLYAFPSAPTIPRVAIVTETSAENADLPDGVVSLCVFNPTDVTHVCRVPHSDTLQPGCWT